MLRLVRVLALLVFAALIGVAANHIWSMYASGVLFEPYNSDRRANITLLVFSVMAVGGLAYFEALHIKASLYKPRYGRFNYRANRIEELAGARNMEDIYAAPNNLDDWRGRRIRTAENPKESKPKEKYNLWMGMLTLCCIAAPLVYMALLAFFLVLGKPQTPVEWAVPAILAGLLVLSLVTAIGVVLKKVWALKMGYVLAICNLLLFPYGTVAGLVLILALVGAAPAFAAIDQKRKHSARA